MSNKPGPPNKTPTQIAKEKWGNTLIEAGYIITPSVMIANFVPATGLSSVDLHILECLNMHWWTATSLPMPPVKELAEAVGCTSRTVQRHVTGMEKMGFLQRIARRSMTYNNTNIYVITDKLKKLLEPFAEQRIENRKINKLLRAKQAKHRGRPARFKLAVVNS
jgi:DNA-binding MarR family transcriptional regulator